MTSICRASRRKTFTPSCKTATLSANTETETEDKDEQGTYLRKERFTGSCSRSFYVGDDISEDDISAKFENGILKVTVPKKQLPAPEETKKVIGIE